MGIKGESLADADAKLEALKSALISAIPEV
jgi:hypothetical protein